MNVYKPCIFLDTTDNLNENVVYHGKKVISSLQMKAATHMFPEDETKLLYLVSYTIKTS